VSNEEKKTKKTERKSTHSDGIAPIIKRKRTWQKPRQQGLEESPKREGQGESRSSERGQWREKKARQVNSAEKKKKHY